MFGQSGAGSIEPRDASLVVLCRDDLHSVRQIVQLAEGHFSGRQRIAEVRKRSMRREVPLEPVGCRITFVQSRLSIFVCPTKCEADLMDVISHTQIVRVDGVGLDG